MRLSRLKGVACGVRRSTTARSAAFPTSIEPRRSSARRARAASTVARSRAFCAGRTDASQREDLWRSAATFISWNRSIPLLLIGLSVPRETVTPASNISGSGATPPEASFMFDVGQCDTLTPWRGGGPAPFAGAPRGGGGGGGPAAKDPAFREPLHGPHARLLPVVVHLRARLGEVRVQPDVLPLRELPRARVRLLGAHVDALKDAGRW